MYLPPKQPWGSPMFGFCHHYLQLTPTCMRDFFSICIWDISFPPTNSHYNIKVKGPHRIFFKNVLKQQLVTGPPYIFPENLDLTFWAGQSPAVSSKVCGVVTGHCTLAKVGIASQGLFKYDVSQKWRGPDQGPEGQYKEPNNTL